MNKKEVKNVDEFLDCKNRVTKYDEELGSFLLNDDYKHFIEHTTDLINKIGSLEDEIEKLNNEDGLEDLYFEVGKLKKEVKDIKNAIQLIELWYKEGYKNVLEK